MMEITIDHDMMQYDGNNDQLQYDTICNNDQSQYYAI